MCRVLLEEGTAGRRWRRESQRLVVAEPGDEVVHVRGGSDRPVGRVEAAWGGLEHAPPAERALDGDWYDVFRLQDARAVFVVGDFVGHDLQAATAMGRLQSCVRLLATQASHSRSCSTSCAAPPNRSPTPSLATVLYGDDAAHTGHLQFVCGGHPPLLLITSDEGVLWDGRHRPWASGTTGSRPLSKPSCAGSTPPAACSNPDTFLPLAEQSGLMRRLTLHVLQLALQQADIWGRAGLDLTVAVNRSASNLLDAQLSTQIELLPGFRSWWADDHAGSGV